MARLKYRHYDEYFDYDGPSRFLLAIEGVKGQESDI